MFLDFAVGVFSAILFADNLNTEISIWIVLWSVIWAFAPDIDVAVTLFRGESIAGNENQLYDHRRYLHYPLLWLAPLWLIASMWPNIWTLTAAINTTYHFLHDSYGDGWGLPWLWPFWKKNYKFNSDKEGHFSFGEVGSWTSYELCEAFKKHGETTTEWMHGLVRSPWFWLELVVFLISCGFLFVSFI